MYDLRFQKLWLAIGGLLVIAVIFLSLAPVPQEQPPVSYDKFQHAFAYSVLMVWFCGIYIPRYYLQVGGLLLMLGLLLELLQGGFGHRMFDYRDLLANIAGILAGLILSRYLLKGWCLKVERRFKS